MTHFETTISEAQAALALGNRAGARQLLLPVVRAAGAQTSGELWWLLGQTLDNAAQQADCLQRASALGYAPPPPPPPAALVPLELPVFPWDIAPDEPAAPPPEHTYSANPPPRKQRSTKAERPPSKPQPAAARYSDDDIAFVVAEFGRHEHRYEIIQKVMQRRDCVFADAEELVAFVETGHSTVIAKKQLPLIMVLSVAAIIGGSYVVFVGIEYAIVGNLFSPQYYIRMGGGLATAFGGLVGLIQGLRRLRK